MKQLYFFCTLLICAIASPLPAQQAMPEVKEMTEEAYQALKEVKINNLEKDTYLKLETGFILDREKPPYHFKFSDGLERKIYLYQIYDTKNLQPTGRLVVYSTGEQTHTLPIPHRNTKKAVWGLYIDDIKAYDEAADGFSSCLALMLSKEGQGTVKEEESEEEEEYEYCFPADAEVMLANGQSKTFKELDKGDQIWASTHADQDWQAQAVQEITVHYGNFSLWRLVLSPSEVLTASQEILILEERALEATANHPVLTQRGRLRIEEIQTQDVLYLWNAEEQALLPYQVRQVLPHVRSVTEVYNLKSPGEAYIVNGLVVFEK